MKNQCPQCIHKQTMKMQTGIIFAACFVIMTFNNFGTGVEVSSKIDLDSSENEETLDNPTLDIITNSEKSPPESILHAPKPSTFVWRHGSEFVKANEQRKRRIYPSHNDSPKQPKIINNIQVIVNSNDSIPNDNIPNENSCEYGICNVSVSSKSDEKGNIITEVHLSIITKAKPNVKIDDIPIINGFRGVSENDKQPIFHSINSPRSMHAYLYRDNIPQFNINYICRSSKIQTNYQGHGEPWYGRTFRQPQMYWNYQYGNHGNIRFRDHKTWPRDRPVVDDKIESPLSKTKPSDEIKL